jgi:hypothetical protein
MDVGARILRPGSRETRIRSIRLGEWKFFTEFVRQIVRGEPGVTEWVRQ